MTVDSLAKDIKALIKHLIVEIPTSRKAISERIGARQETLSRLDTTGEDTLSKIKHQIQRLYNVKVEDGKVVPTSPERANEEVSPSLIVEPLTEKTQNAPWIPNYESVFQGMNPILPYFENTTWKFYVVGTDKTDFYEGILHISNIRIGVLTKITLNMPDTNFHNYVGFCRMSEDNKYLIANIDTTYRERERDIHFKVKRGRAVDPSLMTGQMNSLMMKNDTICSESVLLEKLDNIDPLNLPHPQEYPKKDYAKLHPIVFEYFNMDLQTPLISPISISCWDELKKWIRISKEQQNKNKKSSKKWQKDNFGESYEEVFKDMQPIHPEFEHTFWKFYLKEMDGTIDESILEISDTKIGVLTKITLDTPSTELHNFEGFCRMSENKMYLIANLNTRYRESELHLKVKREEGAKAFVMMGQVSYLSGAGAAEIRTDNIILEKIDTKCSPQKHLKEDYSKLPTVLVEYFNANFPTRLSSELTISTWDNLKTLLDKEQSQTAIIAKNNYAVNQDIALRKAGNIKKYLNKKFYLYAYIELSSGKAFIGRHVLKIGDHPNDVTIMNLETAVDYVGGYVHRPEEQLLVFRMHTADEDKYLDMRFKIGKGKVHQYALGTSLGEDTKGALENHTLILEYDPTYDVAPMTPCAITSQSTEYQLLNENIKKYFQFRENNYIKVHTIPILSDTDFKKFFEMQTPKPRQIKRILNEADDFVFIGYPMSVTSPEQTEYIDTLVSKMSTFLKMKRYEVYIQAEHSKKSQDLLKKEVVSVSQGLAKLEQANIFLLLFPNAIVSSALIEFGIALHQRKKIYVCYENQNDLPWIIRHLPEGYSKHVNSIQYHDSNELLSKLAAHFPKKG